MVESKEINQVGIQRWNGRIVEKNRWAQKARRKQRNRKEGFEVESLKEYTGFKMNDKRIEFQKLEKEFFHIYEKKFNK